MKSMGKIFKFFSILFILRIIFITCWLLFIFCFYSNGCNIVPFFNVWIQSVWLGYIYPNPEIFFYWQFFIRLIIWIGLAIPIIINTKRASFREDSKFGYWILYIMLIEGFGLLLGVITASVSLDPLAFFR